jgi:hypothetical protein
MYEIQLKVTYRSVSEPHAYLLIPSKVENILIFVIFDSVICTKTGVRQARDSQKDKGIPWSSRIA